MTTETRKKNGVERQTTFGPSAPIDEWELEKATLLRESKKEKENAERLQKELEEVKHKLERNTSKLLKEAKLKETTWEKHRQETDESWMKQILELQQQIDDDRLNHEEAIKEMKQHMSQVLSTEQEKHDRRVANLHERLALKEKLLGKYMNSDNQMDDHLPSPITPSTNNNDYTTMDHTENKPSSPSSIQFNNSNNVQLLQRQLKEEREKYKLLEKKYELLIQTNTSSTSSTTIMNPNTDSLSSPLPSPITSTFSSSSPTTLTMGDKETLELEYKKKIQSLTENHNEEKKRLQTYFMNENNTLTMHSEAKLHNLQSEYEDMMREMKDQFTSEKEVWRIEQQTKLDELKRKLEDQYNDQQRESDTVWRNKIKDVETSLSQDGLAIQSYWENKINLLTTDHEKELSRLRSELDVVKSRLGKDIDRRHSVEKKLKELELNHHQHTKNCVKHEEQLNGFIQQQHRLSKTIKDYELIKGLSMKLLPTSLIKYHQQNNSSDSVVEILQQAIQYITRLESHSSRPNMVILESFEYADSCPFE
ncbi:unnamed protein product [Cunninghamella blakesleeana]